MISLDDVEAAASRLTGILRPTPTQKSESLSRIYGRPVQVKPEHLQRTGSFKIRGAYNAIAVYAAEHPHGSVVAASAGNHGQGVALAASLCGLPATIFMPEAAALPKVQATRAYGARVVTEGTSVDDCIGRARDFSTIEGAYFVPPFDDDLVIAGQATAGFEIPAETPTPGTVVVPVGGGGLIAGVASALRAGKREVRILGVEPSGAPTMTAALAAGRPVSLGAVVTMADGVAVRCVSERTLEAVRSFVDRIVTVEEEDIARSVLVLLERCKWVVEPAGALALAALASGAVDGEGPVTLLLSGGNVDPLLLTRLIEHGLSAAGRYLMVRVVISDTPGSLAALTGELGRFGLNLVSVEHRRFGAPIGINEVEVIITLETSDPDHRDRIVPSLTALGYRAEVYK